MTVRPMTLGSGLRPVRHQIQNKFQNNTLNILWVGSYNAKQMFTSYSGAGNTAFISALQSHFTTVNSINGATQDASIHKDADLGFGYYWDLDAGTPGAALTAALTAVDDADVERSAVDCVVIVHGERDGYSIHSSTITAAEAKSALLAYIDYLRAELNNPIILLVPLGEDRFSSNNNGWGLMRRAQWQLWNEHDYIHEGIGFLDLSHADGTSLNQAGYEAFAGRTARRLLSIFGKISSAGTMGPRVASTSFSPSQNRVYVTLAHDAGTDFAVTDRRGQTFSRNGATNVTTTTAIARVDATSYYFSTSTDLLTGDTMTFSWPWGTMLSAVPANLLKDNAANPMPLRPAFDIVCSEIA